jgi:hypothetical protein
MNENQYRKRWLRQHTQYEKIAYKELSKGFKDLGNSIPFDFMTVDNYEMILDSSFNNESFFNIYYDLYSKVGLIHGKRVGNSINKQIKEFTFNSFLSVFEKDLLNWLFQNAGDRVTTVRKSYLDNLKQLISVGIEEGKGISQIAIELTKRVNQRGFYRWQSLRIARTETTAAANYASSIAGSVSGIVLEKVWISAADNRTRRPPASEFNHMVMNGAKVGEKEFFKVPFNGGIEKVLFPGDPKNGSAGNVINCRCNAALVAKRDKDGRIMRV